MTFQWKHCIAALALLAVSTFRGYAVEKIEITPSNDLAVFAPGEEAAFQMEYPKAINASSSIQVTDFDRNVVFEQKNHGSMGAISFSDLKNGYYELTVETFDAAGDVTAKGMLPFAIIPKFDRDSIDWSKNQFGAMVMPHHVYPLEDRELDARFMERIGIRFVRSQRLCWMQMQPDKDKPIDWETADKEVAIYQKYGLDIVANTAWPLQPWAADGEGQQDFVPDKSFPKPEYIEPLSDFMTALAERYKGKVAYWEVGNEVDANLFWIGRIENARRGDHNAIIQDFGDYFTIIAKAIHAGDPDAKVGPNTTGAAPDGVTYRNWLEEFLKHDEAVAELDFFSTHYKADLPKIREVLATKDKGDIDIIITEIGGICSPLGDVRNPTWEEKVFNIPITYNHYVTELFYNGKALCYFLLRELTHEPPVDWLTGLLDKDFTIFPEYVSFATLVRKLAGADPLMELNLVKTTTAGWGQGFAFTRNGEQINVLMLLDADKADMTVYTDDHQVLVTDIMGREKVVKAVDGKVVLPISKMEPLIVTGAIKGLPGEIQYPQPQVLKSYKTEVESFENCEVGQVDVPNFRVQTNQTQRMFEPTEGFVAQVTDETAATGTKSFLLNGIEKTGWYALIFDFPAEEIPTLTRGEYLDITVRFKTKLEDVVGTGHTMAVAWYDKGGVRYRTDTAFIWGTHDWNQQEFKVKITEFPKDTAALCVEFYLGNATGKLFLDDIEISAELYRKSGSDNDRIN